MEETISDILIRYAQQSGVTVCRVPWAEAQRDIEANRKSRSSKQICGNGKFGGYRELKAAAAVSRLRLRLLNSRSCYPGFHHKEIATAAPFNTLEVSERPVAPYSGFEVRKARSPDRYRSGLLCHSCAIFLISKAQSRSTDPSGKRALSAKKQETALWTRKGSMLQSRVFSSIPW